MEPKEKVISSKNTELLSMDEIAKISMENFKGSNEDVSDEDSEDDGCSSRSKSAYHVPYGFQSVGCYKHASKNCEIGGVTYNYRFRQFIILDSRGVTSWSYESMNNTVTRHLNYPAYQFNVLRMLIFSRKFNVYFALSKEYALKVFNLNFHEVISVSAEMHSVLCMVFNPVRNDLITGGTGGMKFWRFGEVTRDQRVSWGGDSRPMANYGLVLRASYPKMGGSWVKHAELDIDMQRLYCLSERNVVAYDMIGNELFQVTNAHRGPVTGCVYSRSCNLLVTTGNDCDVNVWSRSGGLVHTFSGHTKVITKIMVHPDAKGMVITASMDGMVKMYSLDIMEEIYSLLVFPEGINWMDCVSPRIMYCSSNRQIEVFALNHVVDFWALSRCSLRSISLVTCSAKSSRVMAVGSDSSVRLLSRTGKSLSTVLPPPSISPLTQVIDVTYSREFNIMYLLVNKQQIWIYYTRTNPATRLEAWQIDHVEDIHTLQSIDHSVKSRSSSPLAGQEGQRYVGPKSAASFQCNPDPTTPWDGRGSLVLESPSIAHHDRVSLTCLGMLYSHIIMESVEGVACPDATHFLMAGTEDGRVLFLHMFCKGMKYSQLKVHKGLVIGIEHDLLTSTLLTQCRSINGIDVQVWSLPNLALTTQVTCDSDITCHVRMEDTFVCGHDSGYLSLHVLTVNKKEHAEEGNVAEEKRPPSRDHQGPINSVDANRGLEIFCSSSSDGFLRLWDKSKTLLREILLDSSLCAARFLNYRGDVIIGFKQHIFCISHTKVFHTKDLQAGPNNEQWVDDEAFETESDIYEDPSVRYEGRKILQPDPTNMDNYLVPFPNLQLRTSFFMEGKPPPDLQQQEEQERLESISSMSNSLSLAPTDIYYSPYSTPRSMSLASGPLLEQHADRLDEFRIFSPDIWQLPDFGDSPLSSPPRTPPPEPTPPPTPPPEVLTDEEEEVTTQGEAVGEKDSSCEEFKVPVKPSIKKTVNFPSFKKEGGRLSNIRIDSKNLRSTSGGPGYAAPVQRPNVQPITPKQYKPRRPPKITPKKTKKPKETQEESTKQQVTDATDPTNPANTAQNVTTQGSTEGHAQDGAASLSHSLTNISLDGESYKPGEPKPATPGYQYIGDSGTGNQSSVREKYLHRQEDGKGGVVEETEAGLSDVRTQDSPRHSDPPQYTGIPGTHPAQGDHESHENQNAESRINNQTDSMGEGQYLDCGISGAVQNDSRDADGCSRVVYIDPDTGDTVEGTLDKVPVGARIIKFEDENSIHDNESLGNVRGAVKKRTQKSVTFKKQDKLTTGSVRYSARSRGRDLEGDSYEGRGSPERLYVVPGDLNFQGELVGRPVDHNPSPLTIYSLARNRKARQEKGGNETRNRPDYHMYSTERGHNTYHALTAGHENDTLDLRVPEHQEDIRLESRSSGSAIDRPMSSKKSEDSAMKWCINALKKTHTQISFPAKPSRPSSTGTARHKQGDASWVGRGADDDGQTLFIKVPVKNKRQKSTETIHTLENKEEFIPHPNTTTSRLVVPTKPQPKKQHSTRAKTAPPGRRTSTASQREDDDVQREVHDGLDFIGIEEYDEDLTDPMMFRSRSVGGRPLSSLGIPNLDVEDYSGNWQEIVLARARLLKQQRLERQKCAKQRRETQSTEQKERWKASTHCECAPAVIDKSERTIEFITPEQSPSLNATPTLLDDTTKQLKEQELSTERPFRLRIHPRRGSGNLTQHAHSLITLRANQHDVADVARIMARQTSAASIPSKCSRFVLVSEKQHSRRSKPTTLEQTLLLTRFPKSVKNHQPRPRPHSSLET